MGIMTGAASIEISYSTEDGGIATEEITGFGEAQFLEEDVEEYPVNYEPAIVNEFSKEFLNNNGLKPVKRTYELKMVTLIPNNCDGVRIVSSEEDTSGSQSPISHFHISPVPERKKSVPELMQMSPMEASPEACPDYSVLEKTPDQMDGDHGEKEQSSIESCLRESMEVCLDNSSAVFEQVAEQIIINHHRKDQCHEPAEVATTNCAEKMGEDPPFVTSYDGPPVLSPNYAGVGDHIETSGTSMDETPPALTKEVRRGRGRPPGIKRKRDPKHPKKTKSRKTMSDSESQDAANGKSFRKGHNKDALALHRNTVPVVIPHSSAEIQERVKNRQRKATQSYGIALTSDETLSGILMAETAVQKFKSRGRKRSSESSSTSNSETKPKKVKSQNGLFIVEKILKKGIINGQPYFFVKWLNYPSSKNTWEPEENFSLDLIAAYEKKVSETGQLVKVMEGVDTNQPPPEFRSVMRRASTKTKIKCPGCLAYPYTFTDNRKGRNGFDEGLTYHKILESFVLEEERCALVEFDEKHSLELIPMILINERLKAEIKLH